VRQFARQTHMGQWTAYLIGSWSPWEGDTWGPAVRYMYQESSTALYAASGSFIGWCQPGRPTAAAEASILQCSVCPSVSALGGDWACCQITVATSTFWVIYFVGFVSLYNYYFPFLMTLCKYSLPRSACALLVYAVAWCLLICLSQATFVWKRMNTCSKHCMTS